MLIKKNFKVYIFLTIRMQNLPSKGSARIELSDLESWITNQILYLPNQQKNKWHISQAQNYLHVPVKLVLLD